MRFLLAPMILALAASAPLNAASRSNGDATGEFRGYEAINAAISTRWTLPSATPFRLSSFLGDTSNGLSSLLGGFSSGEFRNGEPNALNMLLWYIAMGGLAAAVETGVCTDHSPTIHGTSWTLTAPAYAAISAACQLPDDAAARENALLGVWLATVSYDAPRAEFDAWRAGLGSGTVAALLTGALLDPYFLLEP